MKDLAWDARLAIAAATLAAGCAAPPAPGPTRLADGLTVVRCSIAAEAPDLEAAAASFAIRSFPSPSEQATLRRLGLQVALVRRSDLDTIQSRLGTIGEVTETGVGQSVGWLALATRDAPAGVVATALPGDASARGGLALSVRAWIVPDESDGCLQAELAMHVVAADAPLLRVPGEPPRGTLVDGSGLACCLRQDEALLVLPRPVTGSGKGPASLAELPPSPGVFLLGERPLSRPEGASHASTLLVLMASLPPSIAPPPLDTGQHSADTAPGP
jgi:hypothetical protein